MCLIKTQSKTTFILMQIALIVFFLLQLPARHYPQFHPDLIDAIRGFLLGIVIGMLILTAWKNRQRIA